MTTEPKHTPEPCPFCGSAKITVEWEPCPPLDATDTNRRWFAECSQCSCQGPFCQKEPEVIPAWNKRASSLLADNERLREALQSERNLAIASLEEAEALREQLAQLRGCPDVTQRQREIDQFRETENLAAQLWQKLNIAEADAKRLANILRHLQARPEFLSDKMYQEQIRAALSATERKE